MGPFCKPSAFREQPSLPLKATSCCLLATCQGQRICSDSPGDPRPTPAPKLLVTVPVKENTALQAVPTRLCVSSCLFLPLRLHSVWRVCQGGRLPRRQGTAQDAAIGAGLQVGAGCPPGAADSRSGQRAGGGGWRETCWHLPASLQGERDTWHRAGRSNAEEPRCILGTIQRHHYLEHHLYYVKHKP